MSNKLLIKKQVSELFNKETKMYAYIHDAFLKCEIERPEYILWLEKKVFEKGEVK
jgi:hypothetical protein